MRRRILPVAAFVTALAGVGLVVAIAGVAGNAFLFGSEGFCREQQPRASTISSRSTAFSTTCEYFVPGGGWSRKTYSVLDSTTAQFALIGALVVPALVFVRLAALLNGPAPLPPGRRTSARGS